MADTPPTAQPEPLSFEAGLAELDLLVRTMESGDLGLAESIASYEQGVALLRRLHDELSGIELRVQTLVRLDDDGNPVFEPIAGQSAPAAQANESVTKARPASGRRRSRKPATEDNKSRQRLPGMDEPSETP